ncbi:MAG: glycosyltransferase family 4 protein [Bacteroidota bacterium]
MENRSRIAILVPGGIGKDDNIPSLLELLCRLAETHEIHIYSFSRLTLHPSLNVDHCAVSFPPGILGKNNLLTTLYLLWQMRKDHRETSFNIVHGFWVMKQGLAAVLAGKLLRLPSVVSLLGGDVVYLPSINYGSMRNSFYEKIIRWCIGEADRVTVLTHFQEHIMQENGIVAKHLSIVPFGVDTAKFVFHSGALSRPVRFSFIGNLNKVKDPFTLIKTFSLLVRTFDCSLEIIGTDILNGEAENYARLLGVNDKIEWKGKVPHETIPSILHSTDFLLLTSLYEGEAVVVMEAFASGVVVVGTRVGLLADAEDDRVVASPGDAETLAEKIQALIKHPQTIRNIRSTNRVLAEKHSAEWTLSEYKKVYKELLQQSR